MTNLLFYFTIFSLAFSQNYNSNNLLDLIKNDKPEILESIQKNGKIEEDTEKLLIEVISNYKKSNFEKK